MASLQVNLKFPKTRSGKVIVEIDADKLERLAASLGMFDDKFLKDIDAAEEDFKRGRYQKIKSLKDLRK